MTAWRPRRRRDDGRLYAIVRLGAAGIVYGVVVDTSDFNGNYLPFVSVEAASIEGAYTEILCDERKETAAAFWQRANNYFTSCGITVQRVLTDNGSCYRSKLFAAALGEGSPTSAPCPTAHRPTARSNASTGPCSTNGPTPGSTAAKPSASPPFPSGYTPIIITAATPHLGAPRQPAA